MASHRVFEPIRIGTVTVPNRIAMAPMDTNLASEDGHVTDRLIEHYRRRAAGGVGLVTVEITTVNPRREMKAKHSLAAYSDAFVPGLARLAEAIRREGAVASLQLGDYLMATNRRPADLTVQEIEEIAHDFVQAAERVKQAGFDIVDFHMAHRYTIADFLSRYANKREDSYGKNTAGRAKLAETIVRETKRRLGEDFPVICRINGDEFMVGGNTIIDAIAITRKLIRSGADAIHVSAGGRIELGGNRSYSCYRQVPTSDMGDGLNVHLAEEIKRKAGTVPIITVGKIGTPALIEQIITEGKADMVALGRALLADAEFVNKMKENKPYRKCIYHNDCVRLYLKNEPVRCVTYEE